MPLTYKEKNIVAGMQWLNAEAIINQFTSYDERMQIIGAALKKAKIDPTEANIVEAAGLLGIELKKDEEDEEVVRVTVCREAVAELLGEDKDIANALRQIANGQEGRSFSDNTGHLRVGGYGTWNILFERGNPQVVLGLVDGHMDKEMSQKVRNQVGDVKGRDKEDTVELEVVGNLVRLPLTKQEAKEEKREQAKQVQQQQQQQQQKRGK
ncbi:hypothetical protein [Polyangium fumosum]|uniref:Uncharacterized protein n=1 Tax=Polyangium fumosum TaxID=889272 RepID=A0A4U1JF27_9BACT|nr:hypothetical protein [Polyangium fumosum]TKD09804.1 hypothetical protein E8A74_11640 [Polyangium fumosum]